MLIDIDPGAGDGAVGVIEGRCLCGAVALRVGCHDPRVTACHGRMAPGRSGGLFRSFEFAGPITRHRSSEFADRALRAVRLDGPHIRTTRAEYESDTAFVEGDEP